MTSEIVNTQDCRGHVVQQLLTIRSEILALATDHNVYWKVQREVIQRNARLLQMRSPFLDMLNEAYVHGTAVRIRRLIDRDGRTVSLRNLLCTVKEHCDLFRDNPSSAGLMRDLDRLDTVCTKVKAYVDQYVAHHDRERLEKNVPTYVDLNDAIEVIVEIFRRYYSAFCGADLNPVIEYSEEPLAIFHFPWIESSAKAGVCHMDSIFPVVDMD
jgi:hypothetical protein